MDSSASSRCRAKVLPFPSVIGAEICGVDIARGIDAEEFAAVRRALDDHAVVVLRDQDVSPENQIHFAKGIGTMRPLVYSRYSLPGHPGVMVVSNIKVDGEPIGLADAGSLWHSDGAYLGEPDMYSMLYGIEIPQRDGKAIGDTVFTSAWKAYEALAPAMRKRLIGLRARQSFSYHLDKKAKAGTLTRAPLTAEQKAATPDVDHPVVRRHPNTGRPCLFVNDAHTSLILGLPKAESDELIAVLIEHLKSPRFQYRHSWRAGDLVIWDNCAVQHLATFDYGDIPRRMNRTGTYGPAPAFWSDTP